MTQGTQPEGRGTSLWGARRAPLTSETVTPAPASPPTPLPVISPPLEESPTYQAFETQERAARLNIRCARGPSRYPAFTYLLDIIFDYDFSASFTLIYTFMVVEVRGRNLDPVVHALAHGTCGRITEFHPRRHTKPGENEPFIESIEIVVAGRSSEEEKE